GMQVAEERLLPTREREEGHRCGDADVYADHANLDLLGIIAGGLAVISEDGRGIAERAVIDQIDGVIQCVDADHGKHWPEDLFTRDGHAGGHSIEDGWPEEVTVVTGLGLPSIAQRNCAFGD